MTTKTKAAAAKASRKLFDAVEDVKITDIKPHESNPRVGNVDLIAESLDRYGQYRSIIVNRRNNTIIAGHHCVDDQTEILTDRGWLYGDSLTTDDMVLSMDSDRQLRWSPVNDIYRAPYNGDMHRIVNQSIDALVSPGHKFYRVKRNGDEGLAPVEDLAFNDSLILMGAGVEPTVSVYSDSFVEAVGWAVTEGTYRKRYRPYLRISQKPGPLADQIELTLKVCNADYSISDNGHGIKVFNVSGALAAQIYDVAPDRILKYDFLQRLTAYQRQMLIDTMISADGHYAHNTPYFTAHRQDAMDRFVYLCALAGKQTYVVYRTPPETTGEYKNARPYYVASVRTRGSNGSQYGKMSHTQEHYEGVIWCPNTEHGTFVCRRNGKVYVTGNTWLAARKLGWDTISVAWVDVDEDTHVRLMLMDNKSSDEGDYDDKFLSELLTSLPDIGGTGYDQEELDDILDFIQSGAADAIDTITDAIDAERRIEQQEEDAQTFDGSTLGDEPDPATTPPPKPRAQPEQGQLESASESMDGVVQLAEPHTTDGFDSVGDWGIPRIREDRLMTFEELPDNLDSWAGSATKNWPDDEQWWLYNWGIDSTSGMKDVSKVILSFYCYDHYFESWWAYTHRYLTKVLNSEIKYAITPDWSLDPMPKVESLWNLYRARWVGRYMQEAGLKIIPNIGWPDGDIDFLVDHSLATLPTGLPLAAFQMQTIDWDKVSGGKDHYYRQVRTIIEVLEPQGMLFYAGPQGREVLDVILPDYPDLKTKIVGTRLEKLAVQAKNRQRKQTI